LEIDIFTLCQDGQVSYENLVASTLFQDGQVSYENMVASTLFQDGQVSYENLVATTLFQDGQVSYENLVALYAQGIQLFWGVSHMELPSRLWSSATLDSGASLIKSEADMGSSESMEFDSKTDEELYAELMRLEDWNTIS